MRLSTFQINGDADLELGTVVAPGNGPRVWDRHDPAPLQPSGVLQLSALDAWNISGIHPDTDDPPR
jgi:hypothetical protein